MALQRCEGKLIEKHLSTIDSVWTQNNLKVQKECQFRCSGCYEFPGSILRIVHLCTTQLAAPERRAIGHFALESLHRLGSFAIVERRKTCLTIRSNSRLTLGRVCVIVYPDIYVPSLRSFCGKERGDCCSLRTYSCRLTDAKTIPFCDQFIQHLTMHDTYWRIGNDYRVDQKELSFVICFFAVTLSSHWQRVVLNKYISNEALVTQNQRRVFPILKELKFKKTIRCSVFLQKLDKPQSKDTLDW